MTIVTLKERKAGKVAQLEAAVAALCAELAPRARELGGRYILFGSAARGKLRFDSDVDLLLDFPDGEATVAAWRFAEETCRSLRLPHDIVTRGSCSEAFLAHVLPDAKSFP